MKNSKFPNTSSRISSKRLYRLLYTRNLSPEYLCFSDKATRTHRKTVLMPKSQDKHTIPSICPF